MACDILPSQPSSSAFSPITLFECTITNAQMLIESMADRDLLQALKIANTLHTHIVGVIEPRYDRACRRSDEHESCCQAIASSQSLHSPEPQLQQQQQQPPASSSFVAKNGSSIPKLSTVGSKISAITPMKSETPFSTVKSELLDQDDFDAEEDEEDCLILEEEDSTFAAAAAAAAASPSASSSSHFGSMRRKRHRPSSPSLGNISAAAAAAAAASSAAPGQLTDCKNALRQAYKDLKGNGPHLFDFSLSFNDPANQRVSEQIIQIAQQQMSHVRLSNDAWWNACFPVVYAELAKYDRHRERMKFRMRARRQMNGKLARRQKSFELLATNLSTDKFDKYRIILSRDYTSSDEEGEDEGVLRVRELPWESAEIKEMKQQLDAVYLDNCATQKQVQQLRGTIRDAGCVSGRTPPVNCPPWALAPEYR